MKTFSISNDDLQLLKAIRPFMSGRSQKMLDVMLTFMNIFNPETPDQKINFDALNTLLTMVQESKGVKKNSPVIEVDDYYEEESANNTKDLENLLNIIADTEK